MGRTSGRPPRQEGADILTARVYTLRACGECNAEFTPKRRKRDGSVPMVCPGCAPSVLGRSRRGLQPACLQLATRRKKQASRAAMEARLRTQFGPISDREAAIFSIGVNVGYAKGYASAYHTRYQRRQAS